MDTNVDIVLVAALIGDPSRAAILDALMDGRSLPAGELAARARIKPATASLHLQRLVEGGLLLVEQSGRHRYFRLASPEVARALEALALIAPSKPVQSLRESTVNTAMRRARTCYDHMAGQLGVALAQALLASAVLEQASGTFRVTPRGSEWLGTMGINTEALQKRRRALAPCCLDWSERRYHVGGALGSALLERFLANGWVERHPGSRALRVTESGAAALLKELQIRL